MMQKSRSTTGMSRADRALFDGPFLEFLRDRGLAAKSIGRIRWAVSHAARWLAQRRRTLIRLRRRHAPALLAASAADYWGWYSRKDYRSGLASWFRFREPAPTRAEPDYPWRPLVDDFIGFLDRHEGLAPPTRRGYRDILTRYLMRQFGKRQADWRRVKPKDIWGYAHSFGRGRKTSTLNHDLVRLRRFFRFLHMRGQPTGHLVSAVPRFSNFGRTRGPAILTDEQRRALLASFDQRTAIGARDYCLALCMVDLGLRPGEVAHLMLTSVDWNRKTLLVPAIKSKHERELPLVGRVLTALRSYVDDHRPSCDSDRLFVRHAPDPLGNSLDSRAVGYAIKAAYRRCKFPHEWIGCYRLRHTFATRLHARGADLKHIADLLGHRHLQTTTIYAKVDPVGLRALTVPWPLR
ncbi:MAG TPA: tyrosine-type recombinase/integrase [Opitutaceae bacterium]|nr:tyrosine-type recombinase/integrase [Opitutaceae bacterium]